MENNAFAEALKLRTKKMSIGIIRSTKKISADLAGQIIAKQIIRSATSVAANYRAACRARSTAEFISKLGIVEEEADETCFWIELIIEAELGKRDDFAVLLKEVQEITAIVTASLKTTKLRYKK